MVWTGSRVKIYLLLSMFRDHQKPTLNCEEGDAEDVFRAIFNATAQEDATSTMNENKHDGTKESMVGMLCESKY